MRKQWNQQEVEATVAAYFAMLEREISGEAYNKSASRRRLQHRLTQRSEAAIERKHQNISAILIELGFAYIDGYKPLSNYQVLLREVVADFIDNREELARSVRAQVSAKATVPPIEDMLSVMVVPPTRRRQQWRPPKVHDKPVLRGKVDYLKMETRNHSLGKAGEKFVLRYEKARLLYAGFDALSEKVEHVSETRGDGLGFDILSFETSGRERLIEVKTTGFGAYTPFWVTPNEVAVSIKKSAEYHLYRAFTFRKRPQIFLRRGSLEKEFELTPSEYRARVLLASDT